MSGFAAGGEHDRDHARSARCRAGSAAGRSAVAATVLDVSAVEDRPSTLKLSGKDVDPKSAMPIVLINPEIELRGETEVGVEGCLSFPEITGDIERAQSVLVRAQTLEGEMFQIEASGLLARAIQHEHDHLHGILFIDRMTPRQKPRCRVA
jgi:N-formylmethionyl-tRNA deformylase